MNRYRGDMASPRHFMALVAALHVISLANAGPLPNVTTADMGFKEGSCALGDVVYLPGDEFPGSSPCEKCTCSNGGVECAQQKCEPRPGCKAVHRPDHCCPTYQCECEQEGRVYGNGEKLIDPADPCRVCYCQGGEVVCRRIACFVRDDCTPRLVPGRCCPEYDNCPLRGVTALPGIASSAVTITTLQDVEASIVPAIPKEIAKQEITIKEITPVSEIPVITDVKIKEILPSPSIEVSEYSSSKSPLIPREATTEKTDTQPKVESEAPKVEQILPSPETSQTEDSKKNENDKILEDTPPSKISLSTQDVINSEVYPANVPILATLGSPVITPDVIMVPITTKAPMIEEEEDHNPAFPPLPEDLAVLSNHGADIVPEPSADTDHVMHEVVVPSTAPSTEATIKEVLTTTPRYIQDIIVTTTERISEVASTESSTVTPEVISTEAPVAKDSPMLNLRSAIPTEILTAPGYVPEEINGEPDEVTEGPSSTTAAPYYTTLSTEAPKIDENIAQKSGSSVEAEAFADSIDSTTVSPETATTTTTAPAFTNSEPISSTLASVTTTSVPVTTTSASVITTSAPVTTTEVPITSTSASSITASPIISSTEKNADTTEFQLISKDTEEKTTVSIAKYNIATDVTSQTELSSLPIETSDQNPHEEIEPRVELEESTEDPLMMTKLSPATSEVITVSRANENGALDNVETTEFIVTYGSSESTTDAVEVIKISGEPEKNADIIQAPAPKQNNPLADLINLVSDVALMSDHTEGTTLGNQMIITTSIPDSEELIPMNAGYKSKNSNFNQNSITEIPYKSKNPTSGTKQKVVEIEDDESDSITDAPPPNDRVEPTTRRPIIDNVSDDMPGNKTETAEKKDIEIITQSYVPTINRRPTKVIMKKGNENTGDSVESAPASASSESTTENILISGMVTSTVSPAQDASTTEAVERIDEASTAATTSSQ